MPELPEVETVRRILDSVLTGQHIVDIEIPDDSILLQRVPNTVVMEAVKGRKVTGTGRKGKYFWIEFEDAPFLFGHLGMAGWIRELGAPTIRLREHGEAPLDDAEGRPRFMKFLITAESGRRVTMTDGRRLGRLWLGESAATDARLAKLGPDCFTALPSSEEIYDRIKKKTAPMKAILLDQAIFCGVGNWIADEVLYHSKIAPARLGRDMTLEDVGSLRAHLEKIIGLAVETGADNSKFPADWLFHVRWGGSKGTDMIEGQSIVRETVGGRTTAWVPALQK